MTRINARSVQYDGRIIFTSYVSLKGTQTLPLNEETWIIDRLNELIYCTWSYFLILHNLGALGIQNKSIVVLVETNKQQDRSHRLCTHDQSEAMVGQGCEAGWVEHLCN